MMKKSVKETLKSVIVLFAITLVCVGLLAVANEYLKYEAKLDKEMAKNLYVVCPTGESDDSKAIEYFELVKADEQIKKVNDEHGSPSTNVVAVYKASEGANAGCYIIQSQSKGHVAEVVMLTSYAQDGTIMKTICYSQSESFWSKVNTEWFANVEGKDGELETTDFATNTGATNTLGAITRAVTIANYMAEEMLKTPDAETLASLQKALPADAYERVGGISETLNSVNANAPGEETKVLAVYKASEGANAGKIAVLAQSKNGKWYPPLQMLTAYDENGKIIKTVCHYCEDSYFGKVNEAWYGNLTGKDGTVTDSDFATNTGATNTLATMANAITVSNSVAEILTGGNE